MPHRNPPDGETPNGQHPPATATCRPEPDLGEPRFDPRVERIARAVGAAGGRALVVGGFVRDQLLGLPAKDADLEVFGLSLEDLERVLGSFGQVITVGRSFGVLRVKGLDLDISLPRRDSKVARGHRGFSVETDPDLDFTAASRRRDLSVNSIGLDPLSGEILDPHGGRADLASRRLRATDPECFAEDPLRALRVAQFAARLEMQPDQELTRLCATLDLDEIAPERIFDEWGKLLLRAARPSLGLEFLRSAGLLRFFPQLAALVGVAQDAQWHPEGDVWTHTCMVVDAAAALRTGQREADLALMFAALTHDLGKATTTVHERGRIRSPGHDVAGVAPARELLAAMRASTALADRVAALTEHHLAPALFVKNGAKAKGYRRLARRLAAADVSLELLVRVARADHLGRATSDAQDGLFAAGDEFLARARELLVADAPPIDAVRGRDLIMRGLRPGPHFGAILARCRELQDETGITDAATLLDRVLAADD